MIIERTDKDFDDEIRQMFMQIKPDLDNGVRITTALAKIGRKPCKSRWYRELRDIVTQNGYEVKRRGGRPPKKSPINPLYCIYRHGRKFKVQTTVGYNHYYKGLYSSLDDAIRVRDWHNMHGWEDDNLDECHRELGIGK